jgi:hypothetical protein
MYAGTGRIGNGDYTLDGGERMNIQSKREREKKTVSLMIELYCKKIMERTAVFVRNVQL